MVLALLLGLLLPLAALAGVPGGEFAVSSSPESYQFFPEASMDARGEVLVVWKGRSSVHGRRFDLNGQPRGNDFQVGSGTGQYLGNVSASLDSRGFSVVWGNEDARNSRPSLARRFDDQGRGVAGPTQLSPTEPAVASNERGNSVVVGSVGGIRGQRFDAAGLRVGRAFSVTGNPVTTTIFSIRVAMDATGSFVVVWSDGSGIYGRRFNAVAKPLGSSFKISRSSSGAVLAGNDQGDFVVAWATHQGVFARLYSPSGAQGGTLRRPIFVSNGRPAFGTAVAMDEDGRFLVVWSCCQDSASPSIRGRFFEASGAARGAELQVSTGPGPDQAPAAAAGPSGDFLVVWQRGPTNVDAGDIIGRWLTLP